jgi:hypothetical protein
MPKMFQATKNSRAIKLCAALVLFAGLPLAGTPARAITLARAETGQWDVSLDKSTRVCRITLRAGPVAESGGRSVGMPAGCRKSLPILSEVQTWSLIDADHIGFADRAGAVVLSFSAEGQEAFVATGPRGEIYRLASVERGLPEKAAPEKTNAGAERTAEVRTAAAGQAPASLRASDAAGRYSILREGGKDTGCMLTLDDRAAGKGGLKATLAPACRDQGIVIFDPVGWRLAGGRLELTARKGHTAQFDLQADGGWLKDPKQGKSLGLRKQ